MNTKLIKRKKTRGGVLIEALISILILSIGLLGMAGLQVSAQSFQKTSWVIHRLSELVTDIGEKVRSNPTGVETGLYTYSKDYETSKTETFTLNNCYSENTTCSVAQQASDDIATWVNKAQSNIPQGSALLTGGGTVGFVVTLLWQDKESNENPSVCVGTETGVNWRNCCPAVAAVGSTSGIKCYRASIQP